MNLSKTLTTARKLVEKGFIKGAFRQPSRTGDDCYCAVGAARAAAYAENGQFRPYIDNADRTVQALWEQLPDECKGEHTLAVDDLFKFNDNPATTQQDVLALFDRAIAVEQTK